MSAPYNVVLLGESKSELSDVKQLFSLTTNTTLDTEHEGIDGKIIDISLGDAEFVKTFVSCVHAAAISNLKTAYAVFICLKIDDSKTDLHAIIVGQHLKKIREAGNQCVVKLIGMKKNGRIDDSYLENAAKQLGLEYKGLSMNGHTDIRQTMHAEIKNALQAEMTRRHTSLTKPEKPWWDCWFCCCCGRKKAPCGTPPGYGALSSGEQPNPLLAPAPHRDSIVI